MLMAVTSGTRLSTSSHVVRACRQRLLADVSIGNLLIAVLVPGLIIALVLVAYIMIVRHTSSRQGTSRPRLYNC